jgi:two-component system sensor kinase
VPQALALPNPAQIEATNRELAKEIHERKQIEEILRQNEARYRAIVDDQTELITRFLPDGTLLFVNEAYCRYFGLIREAIIGNRYHPLLHPEDQEQVNQLVNSLGLENPVVIIENRVMVQGQPRWTQWINRAIFNSDGQIVEYQSVGHDIHDRKQAEEQVQASLKEKEVLLKEIHHRVKNNLQIVYSLLRLQRRRLEDQQAADYLLESQNRIESIALIHEKLYHSSDLARINFADYIPSLVTNLFSSYDVSSNHIKLITAIEPITLDIDRAIPCGLIINELVTNALKYAFPNANQGQLAIEFQATPQPSEFTLVVRDDGVGIPTTVDFYHPKTLGLQLVQDLVTQLKGTLQTQNQAGTEFCITFSGGAL